MNLCTSDSELYLFQRFEVQHGAVGAGRLFRDARDVPGRRRWSRHLYERRLGAPATQREHCYDYCLNKSR